jgi:ABC-type polysaccharide/polyol phosphate export permease
MVKWIPDKKYLDYILYGSRMTLKSRYSNMSLGYVWWFLDPIIYMLIFILVYEIIFNQTMPHYPIFFLIGWITWRWMSASLTGSSTSISSRISMLEQISAPKYIFPLINLLVETILFIAALVMVPIAMGIDGVPFTWHIIEIVPLTMVTLFALYGLTLLIAHVGTLVADFKNLVTYTLRLTFYLSPVFYEQRLLPESIRDYYALNPAVGVLEGYRNCLLYGQSLDYMSVLYILLIGLVTVPLGLYISSRYDKKYVNIK